MTTSNPNLLDLFVICSVPSNTKFHLFCRYLTQHDVDAFEYFEESHASRYGLPYEWQVVEGYYDSTHYRYRSMVPGTYIDGFKFGVYDSYEEALNAARAYTADSLLEKYFAVFGEAMAEEG